ncbi:MAG: four helix bundle protein [Candidatus Cloacimonadota bacterium]|nr:MAG: four helix bundle protein [Candidatus Cloacimonadota bacterium]
MVRTHKDLDVWKLGIELVEKIYKATIGFPKEEIYGLTSQMRRAAVSIPSNIAEGAARNSEKEFIQFLYISLGSLSELETQVIIANKIGYLDSLDMINSIEILRKKLLNFIKYVKTKIK